MSASDRVGAPRLKGDAIEAIRRRALHMQDVNLLDETCESILDAVEPIIHADEREKWAALVADGIDAFRLTKEYVNIPDENGFVLLPDIEGWSHFDWTEKARTMLGGESDG